MHPIANRKPCKLECSGAVPSNIENNFQLRRSPIKLRCVWPSIRLYFLICKVSKNSPPLVPFLASYWRCFSPGWRNIPGKDVLHRKMESEHTEWAKGMPRKVLKRQHNDTCAPGTEDTQFSLEHLIHRKNGGCHDHTPVLGWSFEL